jgi:translation initiation factor 5A
MSSPVHHAAFDDFENFTSPADAGASLTRPISPNDLRKGDFVLLDNDKPCRITSITISKPGKHGHTKVVICATDIFTGKKVDDGGPARHEMLAPVVTKHSYLVLHVGTDGYLSLWDKSKGEEKIDVKVPEGKVGEKLGKMVAEKKQINVVVLKAMGREMVVDVVERKQ